MGYQYKMDKRQLKVTQHNDFFALKGHLNLHSISRSIAFHNCVPLTIYCEILKFPVLRPESD